MQHHLSILALLALAAPLLAQSLDEIDPPEGTRLQVVTLRGCGFGEQPRVSLLAEGSVKGSKLKVLSASDCEIVARLPKKLAAGDAVLRVEPDDGGAAQLAFVVRQPQVDAVLPTFVSPDDTIQIFGSWFGGPGVQVKLFNKKAKVLSADDGLILARVPRGVPNGQWAVEVTNAVGSGFSGQALTLLDGQGKMPADMLKAKVGGKGFSTGKSGVPAADLGSKIAFDAYKNGLATSQLSVVAPFAMDVTSVPAVFMGELAGQPPVFLVQDGAIYEAQPGDLPWKVAVLGKSDNHLYGLVSGVLLRMSGPGPATLAVEGGRFIVTPDF